MAQFQYKAMNSRGQITQGAMDAVNVADLELRLGRLGLDLIRSKEVRRRPTMALSGRRITRRELIAFCFHLEQLTVAGVPLLEGLTDLRDTVEHPRFREVLAAMIESIEGGETLSEAMEAFQGVFDDIMIALVRAGEQSGELGSVFHNLTASLKWQDEQVAQTKKLLMYPAMVGTVVIGVIFFLMIYLVPQLSAFIQMMGQDLPAHTKALIVVSGAFVDYWYLIIVVPVLVWLAGLFAARLSPAARLTLDALKLKVWVVGPLLKKTIIARFTNYFALLYRSGITVLEGMRISEQIVGNRAVADAIARAGQQIADGASISASFEHVGLFPPLVLRMLRVGENTGALDAALMNVTYFYSRDVEESIQKLQTLIEPAMTVTLGLIMAWVMFSVLGPIYDLITTIKI